MADPLIQIETPSIELHDALLVIDLLTKKQNTTFLIPLANSVLERLNKSYFEINEINIFEYSTYVTKLKHIIPVDDCLDNLISQHKDKLFGKDAHEQISNMLNKIDKNKIEKKTKQKNQIITIIENTALLSKFSFPNYIENTITPLLQVEKIPELLTQLNFINYINDNLINKVRHADIYFTDPFREALANEQFLFHFLPQTNKGIYSTISSAIKYDLTKFKKENVQEYLDLIIKNNATHLIIENLFIHLINHHITSPDELNLTGLSGTQCLFLEKVKPRLLHKEFYQKYISAYLTKKSTSNYEHEINTLLNTFHGRKNLVLEDKAFVSIIEYITTTSTSLKNKNSTPIFQKIQSLIEFIEFNTTNGSSYVTSFFEQKSKFKKYSTIKPIWERIKLEQKVQNTDTENTKRVKI